MGTVNRSRRAQQRGAPQPVLGQHQQDHEQHDHGQRDAEVRRPRPRGREVGQHVRRRPARGRGRRRRSGQMLRSRPNMAAAMESRTSRVSTWTSRVPPLIGVMRMPASAASAPPDGPRERGQPLGPAAVELRAARGCRPPPAWPRRCGCSLNSKRMPTAMRTAAAEGDRLVVGHVDPEDLELRRVAEEQVVGPRHAGIPDPLGQGDQPEHDADRDHDLGHLGRLPQPPHDADVEDQRPTAAPAPRSRRSEASGAGQFQPKRNCQ